MAQPAATFLQEAVSAARGCLALVLGNRLASSYFDFRQVGLVGSFIALVISLAVQAFGPPLLGTPGASGISLSVVLLGALVIAIQYGVAWAILRLLGRGDALVPFVVVQNWVTLFQAILAVTAIGVFGQPIAIDAASDTAQLTGGSIPFIALGIVALIVAVNIARLILTLRLPQVALFVFTQFATALLIQPMLSAML